MIALDNQLEAMIRGIVLTEADTGAHPRDSVNTAELSGYRGLVREDGALKSETAIFDNEERSVNKMMIRYRLRDV